MNREELRKEFYKQIENSAMKHHDLDMKPNVISVDTAEYIVDQLIDKLIEHTEGDKELALSKKIGQVLSNTMLSGNDKRDLIEALFDTHKPTQQEPTESAFQFNKYGYPIKPDFDKPTDQERNRGVLEYCDRVFREFLTLLYDQGSVSRHEKVNKFYQRFQDFRKEYAKH